MANRIKQTEPTILVQVIRLWWDKSARGGQGACARTTVPSVLPVPERHLCDATGNVVSAIHSWSSHDCFGTSRLRLSRKPISEGWETGCVRIVAQGETARIRYEWNVNYGGAPIREYMNVTGTYVPISRELSIKPSEWAQIRHNGRFTCVDTGNWWYEQKTVNVALFVGDPDPNIFVGTKPITEYSQMADLW